MPYFSLPSNILSCLYFFIIQPHLDYCISVWGSCSLTNFNKIQQVQNRAAPIVTGIYDYSISCITLIKKLGWMTMNQRYFYFTSILVYKCMNGLTSKTLSDRFISHSMLTILKLVLLKIIICLPHPRTNYMKKSFSYTGVDCRNKLPLEEKNTLQGLVADQN